MPRRIEKTVFINFNENKYDPATTWGEILLHKIGDTIQEIVSMNDFTDHYMENYLKKLQSLANFSGWHDV